jgi:phosphatidate cytidylyltransferase
MNNDRWSDLKPRVLSAVVMLVIGGVEVWLGGVPFAILILILIGAMMWELARMTAKPGRELAKEMSIALGLLASAMLAVNFWSTNPYVMIGLIVPAAVGAVTPRRDRRIFFAYALVIMATGLSLVMLRGTLGLASVLWLFAVVIVSDILGYFAGRILGGPKFWHAISPKKTWSGTIAGWIGAALVGVGFWVSDLGSWHLLWVSPLAGFAGQMGDIAESAIKRRTGVKDSSSLIPGHGGLLDRFDALAFAAILTAVLTIFIPLFPLAKG